MQPSTNNHQEYDQALIAAWMGYQQAMQQYKHWGKRAAASQTLREDPQFAPAMRLLVEALRLSGQRLQDLPFSPTDSAVTQPIREMGEAVIAFAASLSSLTAMDDPQQREMLAASLVFAERKLTRLSREVGTAAAFSLENSPR